MNYGVSAVCSAIQEMDTLLLFYTAKHSSSARCYDGNPKVLPDGTIEFCFNQIEKDTRPILRKLLIMLGVDGNLTGRTFGGDRTGGSHSGTKYERYIITTEVAQWFRRSAEAFFPGKIAKLAAVHEGHAIFDADNGGFVNVH